MWIILKSFLTLTARKNFVSVPWFTKQKRSLVLSFFVLVGKTVLWKMKNASYFLNHNMLIRTLEGEMLEMQRFVEFWEGWTGRECKSWEWICNHWRNSLVEEIWTSTESIKEGIHRAVHGYSNDSWVMAVWKNCSASEKEKS